MIDDKYLKILAAIYYLSRQNPTMRGVHSNRVEALLNMSYQDLVPALRYLESSDLLTATWGGSHSALVALTATGTDYVERPLDMLRSLERTLTQTNTINVGGNFNAIESTIVQMNSGTISEADANIVRDSYDTVVAQLPPDLVASQDPWLGRISGRSEEPRRSQCKTPGWRPAWSSRDHLRSRQGCLDCQRLGSFDSDAAHHLPWNSTAFPPAIVGVMNSQLLEVSISAVARQWSHRRTR